jgi:hypothetical protein
MQRTFVLSLLTLAAFPTFAVADENRLDFNRDIRPILSENCFQCHGFDEKARQADLRLDLGESALADRDGVPAIVPGKPDESEVWRRITSTDEAEMMPPPDSHRQLKPQQKETIKRWIKQGAQYAKHWSFIPPVKAAPPEVANKNWPRNEIDRFVAARLDREKLQPSPEADRYTLIRRLALDLTGLPPSAEEVETFVHDGSPDAYEKLVDRLLASPHFGERMAIIWLDAARYADTNGYSIDGGRHMWLWRDWVIHAFNTNMPYDQFLREQLAGDLMPNRTEAQLIATGFQRNNMNTHEGGTIPEENLTNYNVDRVKTLGEAILGLTLGCAQCHDHKFDPITQRDYYQLYAYFNTLSDIGLDGNAGINSRPIYEAKTVLETGEEPALKKQIAALRQQLATPPADSVNAWEHEQRLRLRIRGKDFQLHPVELLKVSTPNIGKGFDIVPPNAVHITVPTGLLAYDVSMRLPKLDKPITGVRVTFHPDPSTNNGRGFGALESRSALPRRTSGTDAPPGAARQAAPTQNTFVLTSVSASAESVPGDQVNLNLLKTITQVTADSWLENYRPENVLDTRNENGWSPLPFGEVASATGSPAKTAHITVTFAEPINPAITPFATIQLNFGHGNNLIATHFDFQAMTGVDNGSDVPPDIIAILEKRVPERAQAEQNQIRAYYAAHSDETKRTRTGLANLEERLRVLTEKFPTMVMDIAEKPRDTFILNRGDYSQPKEKVTPATPAVLPPLPASADSGPRQLAPISGATGSASALSTRLDLANWVTMPDHPLTARVAVNRIWQALLGAGLVATPADFGAQGEFPIHPELLDWLAVDFRDNGWNTKRLIKQIVMSATYCQTSDVAASLRDADENADGLPRASHPRLGETRLQEIALDPHNRLLARGPRFRLPAEFIRDSALKISGLLVPRLGGPSVNPYTPGNLWREISHYGSSPATAQTFEQDHGEKLYRRSLYTYWKRTVPPPNMVAFDAPNRETCTVARPTTTTPLQALVLLNDVQFVEASRAFAERILARTDDDETARLRWAFEECVSRPPTNEELSILTDALFRERTRYTHNISAAEKYLANGESPRNHNIPAPEHAAWSQVAALLLNLSETVTRN